MSMKRTRRSSKKLVKSIATIIPMIAIVVAIISVALVFLYINKGKTKETSEKDLESVSNISLDADDENKNYISETNYKGNLSQFPELYEIPFKKTEAYISNKEFSKEHSDIFDECIQDATLFYETLLNTDYREIASDQRKYVSDVMKYCDYDAYITLGFDTEDERTIYLYDYVKEISSYLIENQAQIEAKFYSDDSLVYSDYYTFVRGELVFTIYSIEDPNCKYETGVEYQIPVEAAIQRTSNNPDDRAVCSFGLANDPLFFVTP